MSDTGRAMLTTEEGIAELRKEIRRYQEKNRLLHRRCQEAESRKSAERAELNRCIHEIRMEAGLVETYGKRLRDLYRVEHDRFSKYYRNIFQQEIKELRELAWRGWDRSEAFLNAYTEVARQCEEYRERALKAEKEVYDRNDRPRKSID